MSGPKAYTMREMKGIVEYLVEHKAYSEYKGRKMWMDFANSPLTTRTWQSLKETFLKRILPDIQNPYYRLTRDQVFSFKQGTDVEAKEKNRLEIRTVEESSNNAENQNDTERPSTSAEISDEAEKTLGEKIKSATITARNRSSADTYIIDEDTSRNSCDNPGPPIKKTTEELLAELESPKPSAKPLKECLDFEHSEPPSVVRDVLNDFETESEGSDKEPEMEIVLDTPENDNTDVNQEIFVVEDSENLDNVEFIEEERIIIEGGMEVDIGPTFDHEIITEVSTTEVQGINNWLEDCVQEEQEMPAEGNGVDEADDVQETTAAKQNEDADKNKFHKKTETIVIEETENVAEKKPEGNKKSLENDNNNQNSLSTTSDSIIPNNQEVLNADAVKSQKTSAKSDILAPLKGAVSQKRSTSQDESLSKKKKLDNGIEPKTNGEAIEKTPPSSSNTEALFDALKKSDNPVEDSTVQDAQNFDESPQNKNPCLKSVSLFEEQFNTTKYSDSDEDTPIPNNEENITDLASVQAKNQEETVKDLPPPDKIEETVNVDLSVDKTANIDAQTEKKNEKPVKIGPPIETQHDKTSVNPTVMKKRDVIVLKSNTDSECELSYAERPKERFKHLAQAFGFVPGTSVTAAQRRRSLRSRNRTKSQLQSCNHHEPSDWDGSISEPELADEYISPPRGRRNRHARKYKKPQAGRIMSLDEDGGLFVVHGNKIIPLVKNGKTLTFVTYDALGCSEEEEELMWRQKYIEEKKKAAELKKQLEQATEARNSRSKSPTLQNPTRNIPCVSSANKTVQKPTEIDMNKQMNIKQIGDTGKIQITLSKNNEETINLEGHWPQVLPIVQQVMSIFYKSQDATTAPDSKQKQEDISGMITPVIPVIDLDARKVDDLESEIFKEIEERDKKEKTVDTNVTKRKAGRPKKTPSTSSEQSEKPAKRPRRSKQVEKKDKLESNAETVDTTKTAELEPTEKSIKPVRKPSVVLIEDRLSVESAASNEPVKTPEKAKAETSKRNIPEQAKDKAANEESDDVSVKTIGLIEPRVTRSRKSGNETDSSTRTVTTRLSSKPKNVEEEEVRYMLPPEPKTRKSGKLTPNKARSPGNPHEALQDRFRNSIDSTQGYQDSDASPVKVNTTKRKRKFSVTVKKGKHITRRRSFPTLTSVHDLSLESSNSSYFIPKKSKSHSTLDSGVYKTESYQILMENRKLSIKKLDVIDETSKSGEPRHFNTVSKDSSDNSNIVIELGSSSNVSLPFSPELSVVENLSISREMIQNDNHPTINEMQANDSVVNNIYKQYLISDVDVSIPLMQQDCELLNTHEPAKSKVRKQKTPIKVSELLNKVCTVNMSVNNTLSDSLDRKLRDLLLESAKKISNTDKENLMDIDEPQVETKKTRGKKRCSTPRKRSSTKRTKPVIGPVIDEHMESCSHGGRNSCPPVITFIPVDENANNSADVQLKTKPKPRVKKDIIKVKIQRPKNMKKCANIAEMSLDTSQISAYTDSGINETASISGVFLQGSDNVELIHNHSETCLQANECISDSIEFVENSKSESIISINSTASLESELLKVMEDVEKLSGEYRRAQDTSGEIYGTPTDTVYHSPVVSNCSLITEDLSDDAPIPPTKWYLLSEDDTNNTNMRPEQMTSNTRVSNFSANLKQLFPIACAVPDLSTISEISRENEGSRKYFDTDGDTRSSDYQSLL